MIALVPFMPLALVLIAQEAVGAGPEFAWIERAGIVGTLFLGIVGFMREWWVPGPTHRRTEAERARLAGLTEQVIPLMTRVSDKLADKVRDR